VRLGAARHCMPRKCGREASMAMDGQLRPVTDVVSHNREVTVTNGTEKLCLSTEPVDKPVDFLLATHLNHPKHDGFVRLAKFWPVVIQQEIQ